VTALGGWTGRLRKGIGLVEAPPKVCTLQDENFLPRLDRLLGISAMNGT
jgi:hypothetical protein